jgi:uncharacterized membrane protein YphA (DoxX/SURF4 family)
VNRKSRTIDAGLALLPLRLFLGVTFVYAGLQKLSDPGFLHPGAPSYIGTQLHAFSGGTPGGFLLRWFALPFPALAGIGVALTEIAIGLLVTAGLLTRIAAGAGLTLNLVLFTTATWNTSPYFLGSDIVFVFAWLPFVLAGASGQPALDNLFSCPGSRTRRGGVTVYEPAGIATMTRDVALRRALAATGVATLAIGGLASLLRGSTASAGTRALSGAGSGAARHHRHTAAPSSRASTEATTGGGSQSVPCGGGSDRLRRLAGTRRCCDLQRPPDRGDGHRGAPQRRFALGHERDLHPRRVRGRIPGRRALLPLPRFTVQRPERLSAPRPRLDAAAAGAGGRAKRRALRDLKPEAPPRCVPNEGSPTRSDDPKRGLSPLSSLRDLILKDLAASRHTVLSRLGSNLRDIWEVDARVRCGYEDRALGSDEA